MSFVGRRTRAAAAAKTATIPSHVASTKTDANDQNFASPKRKDCKLDTDLVSPTQNGRTSKLSPVHTATANGKRNHKNAGGAKTKKSPPVITKYFQTNGHNDTTTTVDGAPSDGANTTKSMLQNDEAAEPLPNGMSGESKIDESAKPIVPIPNGNVLMSPEAKSLLNGGVKQTTPHRIVIRSSPSKKQRLYVKDPVEVFSNLNIRDHSASKGGKKGRPKTRRKLNVHETENHTNGVTAAAKVPQPKVNDQCESAEGAAVDKLAAPNSVDVPSSENTSNKTDLAFSVPTKPPPRRVQCTQMTDYFPIRRSGRKTKQAVEQEISQHIETAIEKQLEDGLIVKVFPEKGRGIVAGRPFQRGEFVVEYIGELIDQVEADRREEAYAENAEFGCYMYYFKHKEQQWW